MASIPRIDILKKIQGLIQVDGIYMVLSLVFKVLRANDLLSLLSAASLPGKSLDTKSVAGTPCGALIGQN
jgi:hypothetical protein